MHRCNIVAPPIIYKNMGTLDDKYLAGKGSGLYSTPDSARFLKHNQSRRNSALDMVNAGVGSITSRDQIINPNELIDPSMYSQTRKGKAMYESDLALLQNFQAQQEAAYEEWFNSPEQAALRERAAGLNPDLVGLDDAGAAAEAGISDVVPGTTLPTNGQVALGALTAISSLASSAASLAGLPLQFAQARNLNLVNDALSVSNKSQLGTEVANHIDGLLATAVQAHNDSSSSTPFDYDAWFADDKNFASIRELFKDNKNIDSVLSLQRSQVLKHRKNMVALQKDWASDQFDFGAIASDPMFNSDQKLMLATNIPLQSFFFDVKVALAKRDKVYAEVDAEIKKGIDVDTAIDAANQQNAYLAALDGRKKAADEQYLRECEVASFKRQRQIDEHLFGLWNANPATLEAQSSMYLLGGMHSLNAKDFMAAYATAFMFGYDPTDPHTGLPDTGSRLTNWAINPTGAAGIPGSARGFIPPGSPQIPYSLP